MNIFFLLLSFALAYTPPEEKPSFSQMEINHIRVTTPGLFDNEKLLELHLEQIPDTAYCFPLPGGKVISPYGRGGGRHSGIDIKTCAKDTIRSAFDGIVRMSKPYSAYGNDLKLGVGRAEEPFEGIGRGVLNIEGLPVYRDAIGGIGTPTSDNERTKMDLGTQHILAIVNGYSGQEGLREAAEMIQELLKKYTSSNGGEIIYFE